jgi:hypothetical protein
LTVEGGFPSEKKEEWITRGTLPERDGISIEIMTNLVKRRRN